MGNEKANHKKPLTEAQLAGVVGGFGGLNEFVSAINEIAQSQGPEISGTENGDCLIGGDGDTSIYGGGGNDTITDTRGHNRVDAGTGNDTVTTGTGNDTIWGGEGDDNIKAGDGLNVVDGGAGNDRIVTGTHSDKVSGGDGNDYIETGWGYDSVSGGEGDDVVYGGGNMDTLYGDAGNDQLMGGSDNDTLYGGDGDDRLYGGSENDSIVGGAGNDVIDGGLGQDYIFASQGDDKINAGEGDDWITWNYASDGGHITLDGAEGKDWLFIKDFPKDGTWTSDFHPPNYDYHEWDVRGIAQGTLTFTATDGHVVSITFKNLETIDWGYIAPKFTATYVGTDANESFAGHFAKDIINAGGGDDYITHIGREDSVYGGDGNDTFMIDGNNADKSIMDGQAGNDTFVWSPVLDASMFRQYTPSTKTVTGGSGADAVEMDPKYLSAIMETSFPFDPTLSEIIIPPGEHKIVMASGDILYLNGIEKLVFKVR